MTEHLRIQPGEKVSDAAVARVLNGLRERTLPEPEWTHGAHLCAGTGLLREVGLARAEEEMPGYISAYNESLGNENTDMSGYHHTITLLYLRVLNRFLDGRWEEPVGALASDVLSAPLADRKYPLEYYSKDLLFSVEARRSWVKPDLKPL